MLLVRVSSLSTKPSRDSEKKLSFLSYFPELTFLISQRERQGPEPLREYRD